MDMFDKARFDLDRVKNDYMVKVKEFAMASKWDEEFKDVAEVRAFKDVIKFFDKHNLIDKERLEE